jgi:cyclopropane-fatty-acyl-phospholipid synthase
MFEHVGRAHLSDYFQTLYGLLRPGGWVLNHGITAGGVNNHQLGAGMGDFIEKYIFPGGELVPIQEVLRTTALGGLEVVDVENLRPHYAKTLWAWSDRLEAQLESALSVLSANMPQERAMRVLRAYRLYLAGCAKGFEEGWTRLYQVLAVRPGGSEATAYPFVRRFMYESEQA